jgi:hypothetical protein
MKPTIEGWAYAAGIVDGEGCIALYRQRNEVYCLSIVVEMQGPTPSWLASTFGGTVFPRPGQAFRFSLTKGVLQEPFLRGILPYLQLKKSQAEIALAYLEARSLPRISDGQYRNHTRTSDEVRLVYEHLLFLMQKEKAKYRDKEQKDMAKYKVQWEEAVSYEADVDLPDGLDVEDADATTEALSAALAESGTPRVHDLQEGESVLSILDSPTPIGAEDVETEPKTE